MDNILTRLIHKINKVLIKWDNFQRKEFKETPLDDQGLFLMVLVGIGIGFIFTVLLTGLCVYGLYHVICWLL